MKKKNKPKVKIIFEPDKDFNKQFIDFVDKVLSWEKSKKKQIYEPKN